MRIVLATHGTYGDVAPLVALARGLASREHDVVLAVPPHLRPRPLSLDVETVLLGPEMTSDALRARFGGAAARSTPTEQAAAAVDGIVDTLPEMYEGLRAVCARSDLLICFPFQIAGPLVRDALGIPYVSLHLSPFGRASNKPLAGAASERINDHRARLGLPIVADPLGADAMSTSLALVAVSPTLFRRPKHWPAHHHVSGYLCDVEPPVSDEALQRFVGDGERPVVVTLGSMTHERPDDLTRILLRALDRAGVRAIVQRGWSGLASGDLPPQVFVADFVPHSWLFPRACCVVHAGSAGSTGAAFRAGVPSVVIPHWLDQPLWAQLAIDAGCAAASIPIDELTADGLADAIGKCLDEPSYADCARSVGARIAAEDGVATACALVSGMFTH